MVPNRTPARPPMINGQTSLKSMNRQKASSVEVCAVMEQIRTSGTAIAGGTTWSQIPSAINPVPNPARPDTRPPASAPRNSSTIATVSIAPDFLSLNGLLRNWRAVVYVPYSDPVAVNNEENVMGATFLVCHGAWSAGWAWKKMHPLMSAAGHRLVTPTYTGLGEREHLANPTNALETHIQDMLAVIKYEDLRDIVLIGHSYGGMVATGVADRARDRISQLIYLDAFVPKDGQSLMDLKEVERPRIQEAAK